MIIFQAVTYQFHKVGMLQLSKVVDFCLYFKKKHKMWAIYNVTYLITKREQVEQEYKYISRFDKEAENILKRKARMEISTDQPFLVTLKTFLVKPLHGDDHSSSRFGGF